MSHGLSRLRVAGCAVTCLLALSMQAAADIRTDCMAYVQRLGSVKAPSCEVFGWYRSGAYSVDGRPILLRDKFAPAGTPRVLVIGGIHGDELSAISIVFDWLRRLDAAEAGPEFHWRLTPSMNPDGLFARPATRTNARGVDLNRNLATPAWEQFSRSYWVERTGRDPRRYPGPTPLSEPETQWLAEEIERFAPDVIVAVHAPLGSVDFDGPAAAPRRIGHLHLNLLGTYPGSLGNYAGVQRGIPVLTVELPYAGIMPTAGQLDAIWADLNHWIRKEIRKRDALPADPLFRTAQ